MLTQTRLKEVLEYDPTTGIFTNRVSRSNMRAGSVAGCVTPNGYISISIDGKRYLAHRLAYLCVVGSFPPDHIDHINGIRDDNRLANLRVATRSENCRNSRKRSNNTTGYKGVWFDKRTGKFQAQIRINGKKKYLGLFLTPEEAHRAYAKAANTLHGEYARTE